ncbi:NAD-glutamate dehydrogenase [Saccharophagus degradans]|uniref:NAD-glutamate dehydrogenase n=1 Tax=Saccharophagus degradans TaxID=86304 RepID=UPI003A7FD07A
MIANFDTLGLIEILQENAEQHFKDGAPPAFRTFVSLFLKHYPLDAWQSRPVTDLFGCCFGLWHYLQTPVVNGEARVAVFNPNLEEHRWECGRTVVTVLQQDMPFLVDSLRLELQRQGAQIHTIKSTVLGVHRCEDGSVDKLVADTSVSSSLNTQNGEVQYSKEALIYIEISLRPTEAEHTRLINALNIVLRDIKRVVDDYKPVLDKLEQVKENLAAANVPNENVAFLQWLENGHFSFLGYREFDYAATDGKSGLVERVDERLGIFKKIATEQNFVAEENFATGTEQFYTRDDVICFSKSSTRSNVHRGVYPDYIVIKKYSSQGEVVGEYRFLGLFTYSVYTLSPLEIPLVRNKVQAVVEYSGLDPASHSGKNLRRVIENFPRDELFQSDQKTLNESIVAVADINERHVVRLLMRKDPFGHFVNCLVYVPREVYTTRIREKIEAIIGEHLQSGDCDSTTYFSESVLARAHIVFKIDKAQCPLLNVEKIESEIVAITRNWDDGLLSVLVEKYGESNGVALNQVYKNAFSPGYQENFNARAAAHDIDLAESLETSAGIAMNFYQTVGDEENTIRFRVMRMENPIELSDVIPIIENLGLRVLGERPYKILRQGKPMVWLHDFELKYGLSNSVDVHSVRNLFEQAFLAVWNKTTESDDFNRLVLGARINWREVNLLRVYAAYMKQTGFNSSQDYIANTLASHLDVTRNLVALFKAYFDPRLHKQDKKDDQRIKRLTDNILEQLDAVSNLNEDRVLRRYLEMFEGSLRTNFFQKDEQGNPKPYVAVKFSPRKIHGIPEPRPLYEIFMYSPRVEGVHLRGGKVARGGLRWSDRLQDYRTEVLGLVKAQQVKNAVIVPNGAKGGFVAKKLTSSMSRDEFMAEGIASYQTFIRALLDITDNVHGEEITSPVNVVKRDEDDPYLVVAADKGTATFSDIANEISLEYGHWLGDAFASGGSQGYDHKGMGITARGAWISVQRHFRERGIDIQKEDFSVIGIGDMAGDVFGNGMLLSEHICLVAAFNHMHIFIDPTPNAATSFAERKRLFETPRTNWADYNTELISKGGGVFSRDAKSLKITPEMKKVFDIAEDTLTPTELITALLKAPVDLLWNGGIGTYVKAASESHAQIGDKANDALRVDGAQLRCKVFGEGGNLGMSQLGRVEFCLNGGACNTDFIDNAAGVDCSDHEVNIKILLDKLVRDGDLTQKQRNATLESMTDQVADLVLQNNYRQTQAISLARFQVGNRVNEYRRFISYLEAKGKLNRKLEFLPTDEQIVERHGHNQQLTRPELSVLISYAKVVLKEALIATDISKDEYVAAEVETAFPQLLREKYKQEVYQHKLLPEIVGTQIANDLINNLGITAGHRLLETTGANISEIAKAYIVSRDVFQFNAFLEYIKSLDNKVTAEFQAELLGKMVRRVRRGTRWFLRNRRAGINARKEIEIFKSGIEAINDLTEDVVDGRARADWAARYQRLVDRDVPAVWAKRLAMPDNLFSGLGVVEATIVANVDNQQVTEVFYLLLDRLSLNWFASQLSDVKVETYWQALARESYIDDLEAQLRKLIISLVRLKESRSWEETISLWEVANKDLIERWRSMVTEVEGTSSTDYAMFAVALRELIDLAQATDHCQKLESIANG